MAAMGKQADPCTEGAHRSDREIQSPGIRESRQAIKPTEKTSTSDPATFTPWRAGWINELYNRMNARYMSRWKAHFVDENSIEHWRAEWGAALNKEQITRHQVNGALDLCSEWYAWPPNLGEFLKACKSVKPPILRSCPIKTESPPITHKGRQEGLQRLHDMAQNLFGKKELR